MTREEFESILEEAYIEGYNTAIEDIQEDILDEEAYDLENEYDYYTETRDDTEFDKGRKDAYKAVHQIAKRFGVDKSDTVKHLGKAYLAYTGRMKPDAARSAISKHIEKATRPIDDIDAKKVLKSYSSGKYRRSDEGKSTIKKAMEFGKGLYTRHKQMQDADKRHTPTQDDKKIERRASKLGYIVDRLERRGKKIGGLFGKKYGAQIKDAREKGYI